MAIVWKKMIESRTSEEVAEKYMVYRLSIERERRGSLSAPMIENLMRFSKISDKPKLLRRLFDLRGKIVSIVI